MRGFPIEKYGFIRNAEKIFIIVDNGAFFFVSSMLKYLQCAQIRHIGVVTIEGGFMYHA